MSHGKKEIYFEESDFELFLYVLNTVCTSILVEKDAYLLALCRKLSPIKNVSKKVSLLINAFLSIEIV